MTFSQVIDIKSETLIVGVDIGSEIHYARAFDGRGVELGRLQTFHNSAEGFKKFEQWLDDLQKKHGKTEVIVGMEPTGHYWFTFGFYLKNKQIKIAIVNPFHVKRAKELDDNSPSKNDRKDPKTIAMLV
ncbi:IS110 family transposase [Carboxydocella sp. JDF658]|nr:IS110 family transposase [Carboxydocella sp. JDF658]